jgi:enterochelin esterase-like enzyme
MSRTLVLVALTAWLGVGISGAYSYVDGYTQSRGFPAMESPAGVARGTLETISFPSPAVGATERYMVYLPPHYRAEAAQGRRFPVLYLLHGSPGADTGFVKIGAADVRMNTLIARHAVRPMILVMPAGAQGLGGDTEWADTPRGRWMDFVVDVVHDVDHRFATIPRRRARGIAGISEGAYGALNIGLRHLGLFSVIESWSGYYRQTPTGPFMRATLAALRANSPADYVAGLAARIHRLGLRAWLLQGQVDWHSPQALVAFADALHAAGADVRYGFYPGGHDWALWRAQTPRMLIAASRWFSRRPRGAATLAGSGRAPLSRAVRSRLFRQSCLRMRVGGPVPIPGPCRAIRAAHGLSNGLRHHAPV